MILWLCILSFCARLIASDLDFHEQLLSDAWNLYEQPNDDIHMQENIQWSLHDLGITVHDDLHEVNNMTGEQNVLIGNDQTKEYGIELAPKVITKSKKRKKAQNAEIVVQGKTIKKHWWHTLDPNALPAITRKPSNHKNQNTPFKKYVQNIANAKDVIQSSLLPEITYNHVVTSENTSIYHNNSNVVVNQLPALLRLYPCLLCIDNAFDSALKISAGKAAQYCFKTNDERKDHFDTMHAIAESQIKKRNSITSCILCKKANNWALHFMRDHCMPTSTVNQ
jgi:hypothetical protein